ncbi:MAG: D-lyxose/D-mannose family sugar isomerase [Rhodobacteraceae bacterium]|nr:D-lyxose/D-mannose family sugar isomerase [Paracoccaceae bacterium]MAY43705.1 D-lyxose/D-mannose family sugar isomerase [Paracoccaceae bacterium]QEW22475.1 ABC-type sugar transport system, auxiliary component [Marinibacterium anthonyi]
MLRSEVNEILKRSEAFIRRFGHYLPPFADWTPERILGPEGDQIRARRLGWDITDYGQGKFDDLGLVLFTTRNGDLGQMASGRGMLYAEKAMISGVDQISPMHRHDLKTEDIINRGGGDLVLELFTAAPDGSIDRDAPVEVRCDGVLTRLDAGGHLRLKPGASVTLEPTTWHAFWAEGEPCMICEVSTVNNDETDNIFEAPIGRFPTVKDDEPAWRLMVPDYPA